MSHGKERHEKICLNCNTGLHGRYCHQCGQENIEPKETVWGLITHFFYDITHFDGKFFSTTKTLIVKPGFLPREYISGRRARYLHPIRMYVFSSAVFFLVFFSLFHIKQIPGLGDDSDETTEKLAGTNATDSTATVPYRYPGNYSGSDTTEDETLVTKQRDKLNIKMSGVDVKTIREYDSLQAALPPAKRDGWLERRLTRRNIELKQRYKNDDQLFAKELLNKFIHTFPYLLFLSLPLYALFLKLLYIRHKEYYYTEHGIFLIYLYIFTFIIMLLYFSFDKLDDINGLKWLWALKLGIILYGIWYAYKAMRRFYRQGRGKTLLKFLALNFLAVVSLIFLFTFFFVISVYQL